MYLRSHYEVGSNLFCRLNVFAVPFVVVKLGLQPLTKQMNMQHGTPFVSSESLDCHCSGFPIYSEVLSPIHIRSVTLSSQISVNM
jgi:hypothetical protein